MARSSIDLDLSGPERELKRLGAALRKAEDGKELRRELVRNIRSAAGPARQEARQAIKSMPSRTPHKGRSLRSAIAQKVRIEARPAGKSVGARIVVGTTESVRGFKDAPRRTNARKWRHPRFGNRQKWADQTGKPGWFDDTMKNNRRKFRRAVVKAMDETADKIARLVR
ncbi:hypothetical protein [Saccharopolyspora hattusasensis]|uniref:hypothetical protein n=1 Tax=Saccharopolyspora hattusasensis TaxID=1128679 RepID=UPI003D965E2F